MTKEKESIGFRTRAKEIQDTFAKVQAELSKTKADWAGMRASFAPLAQRMGEVLTKAAESGVEMPAHFHVTYEGLFLSSLISKLGMELIETHERLAACEKAIREIKLGK